jgi:hypothetical protein
MASEINYVELIDWNRQRLTTNQVKDVQQSLGLKADGIFGPKTLEAVLTFQRDNTLIADGKVGRQTLSAILGSSPDKADKGTVLAPLTPEALDKLIEITVLHESAGRKNPYGAQNRDLEYEGAFDRPTRDAAGAIIPRSQRSRRHWASKYKEGSNGVHIGLSWGCIQFTQDGGALGSVLHQANELDRNLFVKIMGDGDPLVANALLNTVLNRNSTRHDYPDGSRRDRVKPVDGADLWEAPWTDRFDRAAEEPVFQLAQRIIAAADYLFPAIQMVLQLGALNPSQEDLAVAFDLCVHLGPGPLPKGDPIATAGYRPVSSGRGASKQWCKAVNSYKRGAIASEVIRLMASSERARRQKIMSATDERLCYDRAELAKLTRHQIINMLTTNYQRPL